MTSQNATGSSLPQRGRRISAGVCLGLVVGGLVWLVGFSPWRPVPHVSHQPLPQAVYVWQREWTKPVADAVAAATQENSAFSELLVFGAEIVVTGAQGQNVDVRPVLGVDWPLLAKARRPVGIVVRVRGTQGTVEPSSQVLPTLRATLANLCHQAHEAGVELAEVQVDLDCPTSRLPGFAALLTGLRRSLPGQPLTFTALPAWLHAPAFAGLARAADGYVLQVHSFEISGPDHRPPATLCDPRRARQAVEEAARLGVPFRVALPTYGYRLVLDARGHLLAAAAEGAPLEQAQAPPGGGVRRLDANAKELAELVAGWQAERPRMLAGAVWYRLPVPGSDRLNWPPVTLAAVMAGHPPTSRLRLELLPASNQGDAPAGGTTLWEVLLRNVGKADATLPPSLWIECRALPVAMEGIGPYEFGAEQASVGGAHALVWQRRDRGAERHLAPGTTLACGWLRLPSSAQDKPVALPPTPEER